MDIIYTDGGREEAGYKNKTGDCVVRAISIATKIKYKKVYEELDILLKNTINKSIVKNGGIEKKIYRKYLKEKGWQWIPTMFIGKGCKVHLKKTELPNGIIIVSLSQHLTTVINGVIYDTYDPSRHEKRCVYGYYQKEED